MENTPSAAKEMNTDEWHMQELRNSDLAGFEHISEWNKGSSFIEIILYLF